jgi:Domain of unknown function
MNDRDARRNSMQNLSVVAVLLATVMYVAFSTAPNQPALLDAGGTGAADAPSSVTLHPLDPHRWLRHFFRADQVGFAFAMGAVLFVLIGSLPRVDVRDDVVVAGRFWLSLLLMSACLGVAIIAGMLSFILAGVAAYPERWLWADVGWIGVVAGVLVLIASAYWVLAFYRTFPGLQSVGTGIWSMVCFWKEAELKESVPGMDESAHEIRQELSELKAGAHAMKEELVGLRKQLAESAQETNRLLACMAGTRAADSSGSFHSVDSLGASGKR